VILLGSDRVLPGIKIDGYTQAVKMIKVVVGITIGKSLDLLLLIHRLIGCFLDDCSKLLARSYSHGGKQSRVATL
jgi:hypothetical protein